MDLMQTIASIAAGPPNADTYRAGYTQGHAAAERELGGLLDEAEELLDMLIGMAEGLPLNCVKQKYLDAAVQARRLQVRMVAQRAQAAE